MTAQNRQTIACPPGPLRIRAARAAAAVALGLVALAALAPARAAAFCRAGVDTPANGPCVEDPDVPRLHWLRGCVRYRFHDKAFTLLPALDQQTVRDDVAAALATWNAIDCDREPMRVEALSAPADEDHAEFEFDRVNQSVVSAHDAREWQALEYDPSALAMTLLFVNPRDGEIYDADIELNAGAGPFMHCDGTCKAGAIDLRNALQHETGHYLGLGHSDAPGATMAPYSALSATDKITLEPDDEAGYCALEMPPPDDDCDAPVYPSRIRKPTGGNRGCAIAGAGPTTSADRDRALVFALALGIVALRGRRPRRRR